MDNNISSTTIEKSIDDKSDANKIRQQGSSSNNNKKQKIIKKNSRKKKTGRKIGRPRGSKVNIPPLPPPPTKPVVTTVESTKSILESQIMSFLQQVENGQIDTIISNTSNNNNNFEHQPNNLLIKDITTVLEVIGGLELFNTTTTTNTNTKQPEQQQQPVTNSHSSVSNSNSKSVPASSNYPVVNSSTTNSSNNSNTNTIHPNSSFKTISGLILNLMQEKIHCEQLQEQLRHEMSNPNAFVNFEDIRDLQSLQGRNILVLSGLPPDTSLKISTTPMAESYPFECSMVSTSDMGNVQIMRPKSLGQGAFRRSNVRGSTTTTTSSSSVNSLPNNSSFISSIPAAITTTATLNQPFIMGNNPLE
jgi:hypothetical protein